MPGLNGYRSMNPVEHLVLEDPLRLESRLRFRGQALDGVRTMPQRRRSGVAPDIRTHTLPADPGLRGRREPDTAGGGFLSPVMISNAEFADRRTRAGRAAADAGYAGLLVIGRSSGSLDMMYNVHWLTHHYFVPPAVAPTGPWRAYGFDLVLIDGTGRSALATCGTTDAPALADVRLGLDVEQLAVDMVRDFGLTRGRLGLVGSEILPWTIACRFAREFPDLTFEAADLLMAQVRFTLSPTECDMVRQAVAAGSRTLLAGLRAAVPGATDGDVVAAGWAAAARTERQQHWNFIAASGPQAGEYAAGSLPSWNPTRRYERGDMIHPDCYGYVDGYMYDVQRTMVVGAAPTARQQWLIDGSWDQAQTLGAALRDGITCREIYDLGVGFMANRGYRGREQVTQSWQLGGHFGHGYATGFDWPWLGVTGPLVDLPLRAPFAVTIELYWQEQGIGQAWVEDDWLILPDHSERLSSIVPKSIDFG